jgi:hypothetical protein
MPRTAAVVRLVELVVFVAVFRAVSCSEILASYADLDSIPPKSGKKTE